MPKIPLPPEGPRSPEDELILPDPVDKLGAKRREIASKLLGVAARARPRVNAECDAFHALGLEIAKDQELAEGLSEALTDDTIEYAEDPIERVERWARQQLATRQ